MVDDVKWDMVPLGLVAEFHTGWTPPSGDDRYYGGSHKWANISDVGTRHLYDTERTISDFALEKQPGARLALPGDLLFPFKLSIGAVSFACEEMYTNEAIAVFPPNEKFDLRFAYYAFPYFLLKNAGVNIYGAPLLNSTLIKQARVPSPPLETQHRIADYLDRETAEIDAAVADLDRYVGLLEKRRNLVITDAVTSADSVKLAHLVRFGNGQDWRDVAAPDGEFPVYGSGGEFGRASDFIHDGEAVLFGRKGTVNRPIYVDEKFWTVDTMYYAVPYKDKCVGKYLYYWATTIPFETITTNTALPSVTSMDLSQLYVPLPPLESQQRIADYLDRETTEIDSLIAESIKLRDLLLKRRSVLIAETVTGRKQV